MASDRVTDVATVGLGVLYVAAGIAETVRAVSSGDGGVPFWFGTLVGGGSAVLVGHVLTRRGHRVGTALVVLGALAGMIATAWTLVVPLLALTVVVLTLARSPKR